MVKMHSDEIELQEPLVRNLIAAQFPRWANLPLCRVQSAATDHALFRLGEEMVVRLPRIHEVVAQVEKEQRWLPILAPRLPLPIPMPLAHGAPGDGYPWIWSVYRWLEGETATAERIGDSPQAALDLARFLASLQQIDTTGAPVPGAHNFSRGVALAERDQSTRKAIAELEGLVDTKALATVWEETLEAREFESRPVWIHGDLNPGNLLVQDARVTAVLDFGGLAAGDPACDAMAGWTIFSSRTRMVFREALQLDEDTWRRGRGWALSTAVIALPYYLETNPSIVRAAKRTITEVLSDFASGR